MNSYTRIRRIRVASNRGWRWCYKRRKISLAYWLPNVPDGVKVPVIAEIGLYFQEPSVQTPTIEVPAFG